ncbi:MAG TPA: hypothetical protein VMZ30_03700 [Pyrinomonadaceae bacterium]|nr:hypothetical protein [Pyrinomonadaceae bacterium]
MKNILPLFLILSFSAQNQSPVVSGEISPITVVSFKWFKDRQSLPQRDANTAPAAAMIPQNRNFERNRRANTSPGERDPNLDTLDGRSAAMEKAVQDSRAPKPVDGFAYQVKIHNASPRSIEIIFWEYQFRRPNDPVPLLRRQFLCGISIKPEKDKELKAFSLMGPQDVINVDKLEKKSTSEEAEKVVINRIEFADGSIWQRKDWNFGEVRLSYARAVATPWGTEMCRSL